MKRGLDGAINSAIWVETNEEGKKRSTATYDPKGKQDGKKESKASRETDDMM